MITMVIMNAINIIIIIIKGIEAFSLIVMVKTNIGPHGCSDSIMALKVPQGIQLG